VHVPAAAVEARDAAEASASRATPPEGEVMTTKHITIPTALQRVADYPVLVETDYTVIPVHELICRSLFEIANGADDRVRGSGTRANRARNMIMTRLVGRRRSGTKPHTSATTTLEFKDLTGGALDAPEDAATSTELATF
jgi:hypothetical protein